MPMLSNLDQQQPTPVQDALRKHNVDLKLFNGLSPRSYLGHTPREFTDYRTITKHNARWRGEPSLFDCDEAMEMI